MPGRVSAAPVTQAGKMADQDSATSKRVSIRTTCGRQRHALSGGRLHEVAWLTHAATIGTTNGEARPRPGVGFARMGRIFTVCCAIAAAGVFAAPAHAEPVGDYLNVMRNTPGVI